MKDHNLADAVGKLIQSEKDIRSKCQRLLASSNDESEISAYEAVIRSKDRCILELNKIFELLS